MAGAVWVIGSFTAKRAARSQSVSSRVLHAALAFLAFLAGFTRLFQFGRLARPFAPPTFAVIYAGVGLTFAGIALAIWARFFLGGNWSSTVTVKVNHTLIRRGPYSIVRHPIYSSLLLALFGTVLVYREVQGLVATGLVFFLLLLKARLEEEFMTEQFGTEYLDYRRHVKAIIPFVW